MEEKNKAENEANERGNQSAPNIDNMMSQVKSSIPKIPTIQGHSIPGAGSFHI
jgi:hypothetical protein